MSYFRGVCLWIVVGSGVTLGVFIVVFEGLLRCSVTAGAVLVILVGALLIATSLDPRQTGWAPLIAALLIDCLAGWLVPALFASSWDVRQHFGAFVYLVIPPLAITSVVCVCRGAFEDARHEVGFIGLAIVVFLVLLLIGTCHGYMKRGDRPSVERELEVEWWEIGPTDELSNEPWP